MYQWKYIYFFFYLFEKYLYIFLICFLFIVLHFPACGYLLFILSLLGSSVCPALGLCSYCGLLLKTIIFIYIHFAMSYIYVHFTNLSSHLSFQLELYLAFAFLWSLAPFSGAWLPQVRSSVSSTPWCAQARAREQPWQKTQKTAKISRRCLDSLTSYVKRSGLLQPST